MRSRAEAALRAVALAALALALWRRMQPGARAVPAAAQRADERGLAAALGRWTAAPVAAARVQLDTLPDARTRAWLAALAAAGTRVTWTAARAPALAADAEPVADPAGGARLLVAAPPNAHVRAADALGPLDSAQVPNGSAAPLALALPDAGRAASAAAGGATARVAGAPAPRLGAVLVAGRAGWESKFAAAALEERGWAVRTRFALAPAVTIASSLTSPRPSGPTVPALPATAVTSPPDHVRPTTSGSTDRAVPSPPPPPPPHLDTATLAAVVVLDSTAAPFAPALARYVRAGGGLVLAGDGAAVPAFAALAAAGAGAPVDDSSGALRPLERPRPDAVPLAWRRVGGARTLVAAARRVGAGRVVQLADAETWRRRMRPDDAAAAEHRAWWAQAIAAAAYAPFLPATALAAPDTASRLAPPTVDPAPFAATVAALGLPVDANDATPASPRGPVSPASRLPSDAVLVPLALAALLGEVASRRLRGAA